MNVRRKLGPLAALAVVALIGAGCSSGSAENGDTAAGGSGGGKSATSQSKTEQFGACMRENGVPDFPDSNGASDQEFVAAIEKLDPDSAPFKKAIGACRDLQPPGLLGGKATPQQTKDRLEFAQCIRENGVADFPDPASDAPLVDTNRIPSSATEGGMATLNAAMQKCRDAAARAIGDR
jgi:hypothetical protein